MCTHLPVTMKKEILEKKIRFYTINAARLGEELGLGKRINMIMQTAFFALSGIIPQEQAVSYLKQEVQKNYEHQGQQVIDRNYAAIDNAAGQIHKVNTALLEASLSENEQEQNEQISTGSESLDFFVNQIMIPMNRQKGDEILVSAFEGMEAQRIMIGRQGGLDEKKKLARNIAGIMDSY